jgi:hypothetical protein
MMTHSIRAQFVLIVVAILLLSGPAAAADKVNPFIGSWALTIPSGEAGWLGVTENNGALSGSLLWGGGDVSPVAGVTIEGDKLVITRSGGRRGGAVDLITATREGDNLKLVSSRRSASGVESNQASFTGKLIPPLPPAPDLTKVKYGEPITLFNGKNLDGWKLTDPKADSGWSVKDGVLTNDPAQEAGKAQKHYGNLRTEKEFEDFNLTLETNVPKAGNSGIYLRGIYEVQVSDSYGSKVDPHNMGAIYSRITPSEAAEKPAGQWQTFDITLVDRHVTVILNGKKIIDNKPLLGCTGGALWSDQFKPGPIYLQGDHTGANYRNIVLKPVVK